MKRMHPKIIRLRNRIGATYDLTDTISMECLKAFNCPSCGTRIEKGTIIFRGSYVSSNNGWHIRHKRFCSNECLPDEIKSN